MKKHGQQYAFNEELVLQATNALSQKFSSSLKPFDLKTSHNIDLGITFQSIPKSRRQLRLRLPHPLYSQETHTVCLLTCYPKQQVKQLIADSSISCVKKVLTIKSLNRKYRQFEARRELVTRYDVFLTDSKACPYVTRLLGKIFIQKHKIPQPIRLRSLSLSKEITNAFSTVLFHISSGSTSSVTIGSFDSMSSSQLADNAIHCLKSLMQKLPPGWSNLRNAFVKSFKSIALPIFTALPTPPPLKISMNKDSKTTVNALPKTSRNPNFNENESSDEDVMTSLEGKYSVLDRASAFQRASGEKKNRMNVKLGGKKKKKKFRVQSNLGFRKKTPSHSMKRK